MNKNEKFVITINREVGTGGRTVGRKLAAQSSCVVAGRTGFMVFREWPNYQLVISMDDLSEDDAVEVIMDYINRTSK